MAGSMSAPFGANRSAKPTLRQPPSNPIDMPLPILRALSFAGLALSAVTAASTATQPAPGPLDLVIAGGRVIDPESGLDAIRHVGIRGDRIVVVSPDPLEGRESLDAGGLVVTPGFIDLHRHAHGDQSHRYAAREAWRWAPAPPTRPASRPRS
jgi:hypothetical protein